MSIIAQETPPLEGVRAFYRIVRTDPPTLDDFLSNSAKGKQLRRPTPEALRLWDGISVYDSLRQARSPLRRFRTSVGTSPYTTFRMTV